MRLLSSLAFCVYFFLRPFARGLDAMVAFGVESAPPSYRQAPFGSKTAHIPVVLVALAAVAATLFLSTALEVALGIKAVLTFAGLGFVGSAALLLLIGTALQSAVSLRLRGASMLWITLVSASLPGTYASLVCAALALQNGALGLGTLALIYGAAAAVSIVWGVFWLARRRLEREGRTAQNDRRQAITLAGERPAR